MNTMDFTTSPQKRTFSILFRPIKQGKSGPFPRRSTPDGFSIKSERESTIIQKIIRWEPDPNSLFVHWVLNCNLPGLKEAVKPGLHILTRLYWLYVFLQCVGLILIVSFWAISTLNGHPLLVIIDSVTYYIGKIRFPTVAITLLSNFKLLKLNETVKLYWGSSPNQTVNSTEGIIYTELDTIQLLYIVDQVCRSTSSLSSLYNLTDGFPPTLFMNFTLLEKYLYDRNETIIVNEKLFEEKMLPFLKNGIVNCSELIAACSWNGKPEECRKQFRLSFTEFGGMCSFNQMPAKISKKYSTVSSMLEGSVPEMESKLWTQYDIDKHLILQDGIDENDSIKKIPKIQHVAGQPFGLSILAAYNASEYRCPQQDGVGLKLAIHSVLDEADILYYGIVIFPFHEVFVSIHPEITLANEEIRQVEKMQRGCFFSDEVKLKYYMKYTQRNCLKECLALKIKKECNCSLLSGPVFAELTWCDPRGVQCAKHVQTEKYGQQPEKICGHCLPGCTEVKYRVKVTQIPYSKETPPAILKDRKVENKTTSIIHAYYEDVTVVVLVRKLRYNSWEIFGLIGGIFGFTMNLTCVEFGYWVFAFGVLIERVIRNLYPRRRRIVDDVDRNRIHEYGPIVMVYPREPHKISKKGVHASNKLA